MAASVPDQHPVSAQHTRLTDVEQPRELSIRERMLAQLNGQTLRVPDLGKLMQGWPEDMSPNADAIDARVVAMIETHAITPSVRNRLTKARLSDQLAGWYPWATPERLRALTSFQVWMFVVDDEIDQCSTPSSFDSERFTALVDECQDFVERSLGLREGGTENQKYQYHDVIVSFADFADSISSTCSKAYRRRIADEAYVTLQGYRLEAELRARGVYPTEEQYLAYRYGSSCIGQVNEMLEYANGMDDNTAEFSESPEIRELYRASVTVTWLVNDIVSVRKELQGGFLENLVVIYAEGDLEKGVQRALALLEKEISALTTAYAAAVKRFEGTPPYAEKVKKLADNCLNLNRRTWLWSTKTPRYGLFDLKPDADGAYTCTIKVNVQGSKFANWDSTVGK